MRTDRSHISNVHLYIEAHVLTLPLTGEHAFTKNITDSERETLASLVNQRAYMKPLLLDTYDHYTPLQLAVLYDIPHIVEFFLNCTNADVNVKDVDGRNVIQLALVHGVTNIQQGSTLHRLVHSKDFDVSSSCNIGYTLLHYCFFDYRLDCRDVALLLVEKFGADIEAREITGKTALHIAMYMNTCMQVRFLIEVMHANIHCVCDEGWTLLHSVCANPDHLAQNPSEIYALSKLQYLIYEKGFVNSINIADKDGVSPLHLACFASKESEDALCICQLLACGARPDALDNDGDSPLHDVITSGNISGARMLLVQVRSNGGVTGAKDEITRCNRFGRTALHTACYHGRDDMLNLFQRAMT